MGIFRSKHAQDLEALRTKLAEAKSELEEVVRQIEETDTERLLGRDDEKVGFELAGRRQELTELCERLERAISIVQEREQGRLIAKAEKERSSELRALRAHIGALRGIAENVTKALEEADKSYRQLCSRAQQASLLVRGRDAMASYLRRALSENHLSSLLASELIRIGARSSQHETELSWPFLPQGGSAVLAGNRAKAPTLAEAVASVLEGRAAIHGDRRQGEPIVLPAPKPALVVKAEVKASPETKAAPKAEPKAASGEAFSIPPVRRDAQGHPDFGEPAAGEMDSATAAAFERYRQQAAEALSAKAHKAPAPPPRNPFSLAPEDVAALKAEGSA